MIRARTNPNGQTFPSMISWLTKNIYWTTQAPTCANKKTHEHLHSWNLKSTDIFLQQNSLKTVNNLLYEKKIIITIMKIQFFYFFVAIKRQLWDGVENNSTLFLTITQVNFTRIAMEHKSWSNGELSNYIFGKEWQSFVMFPLRWFTCFLGFSFHL